MADLKALNYFISLKGVSKFKQDMGDAKDAVLKHEQAAEKAATTYEKQFEPAVERSRAKVRTFEQELQTTRRTINRFASDISIVSRAASSLALTLAAPLVAAVKISADHNIEMANAMRTAKLATDELFTSIGTSLTPIVQDVAVHLRRLSGIWQELPKHTRDSTVQAIAFTAALSGVAGVVLNLISRFVRLGGLIATPGGMVVAGLVAMTAASLTLVKVWEKLTGQVTSLNQQLMKAAELMKFAVNPMQGAVSAAMGAGQKIGQQAVGGGAAGPVNLGEVQVGGGANPMQASMESIRAALQEFKAEFDAAFRDMEVRTGSFAKMMATTLVTAFESLTAGIGEAVAQSIVFGKSFEETMRNILKNIAAQIISSLVGYIAKVIILRSLGVVGPISTFALGLGGGGGSGGSGSGDSGGGGGGGGIMGALRSILPFADGGIVRKPTLGLIGEAGPEAVVPLDQAGSMGSTEVTINMSGPVFLNDEASKDRFIRQFEDALIRITKRRTGGTVIGL